MNKRALALLLATLGLLTIGVVMLFSTSAMYANDRYDDAHYLLKRQLVWILISAVACVAAARLPYPKLRAAAPYLLGGSIVLLILVLVPGLGVQVGGARRWLALPGIRFQPSELGKIALIIWLAHWLATHRRRFDQFQRGCLVPIGVVAFVLGIVLVEPDYGTTALLGAVAFGLMFVAGVRLRYLVPTILAGATGFTMLMIRNPERAERLLAFLDLEKYRQGAGYQVWQAILAFGSGGVSGLGLGNSRQKMFYLPEAHTDFIFPIIGEELGLIGTLTILVCFAVVVFCGLVISLRAPDSFGQYLGLGIVLLLAMQALINIGVVTAWLPTKGLPLPFISAGGSNLVMSMTCIGMLFSIHHQGTLDTPQQETEFFATREAVA